MGENTQRPSRKPRTRRPLAANFENRKNSASSPFRKSRPPNTTREFKAAIKALEREGFLTNSNSRDALNYHIIGERATAVNVFLNELTR